MSNNQTLKGYDIIGDIHGCSEALERLLIKLGYSKVDGVYGHPDRKAVFVGDIIDRGPHIRQAAWLVHDMVKAGNAHITMGNHEYNAIAYMTVVGEEGSQEYLREHNHRHTRIMRETLDQFADYQDEWQYLISWFLTIPVFLELPGFRVVHACWDEELIEEFKARRNTNTIDLEFLIASSDLDSFEFQIMDRLLRGTNLKLPNGMAIEGKDGYVRQFFRTKFWTDEPDIYQDIVFQPDPLPDEIAQKQLTDEDRDKLLSYADDAPPLFFGHYWRIGKPECIKPNLACLDYSAVKYGKLVAYRFDGEEQLSDSKYVFIDVTPTEFPLDDSNGLEDLSRV
ncbi:metallophosphoesterase [Litoribacillus peritrichatus]|uniref:Metallophosphoesterase n=1 Tax=Litoribacillus peritrichatus TaxID=718191 RepID=A0ABP7M7I3_9GAMM